MSAQAVETEILAPMQRQFYPPKQNMPANDQQNALRDYVTALQGFDAVDLKAAWVEVCSTHTKAAWPLPAVFVLAARGARKARLPEASVARSNRDDGNQRWEVWKAVSRSGLAREAARRGLAWSLKCAILHDGKTPEQVDLRALAIGKASAERTANAIQTGQPIHWRGQTLNFTPDKASLALSMWDSILKAEAQTQAEINYGERHE